MILNTVKLNLKIELCTNDKYVIAKMNEFQNLFKI